MITRIQKRDGSIVPFNQNKIAIAIDKAFRATKEGATTESIRLATHIGEILSEAYGAGVPNVENTQDFVEQTLMEEGYIETAKAYIIYRKKHEDLRVGHKNLFMDAERLVEEYISLEDWRINENANMGYSLQGLNNHIVEEITKKYWLNKIYTKEQRQAHINGDIHIHDLGLLAPYCCGWDLETLLLKGFRGAAGKMESSPAKHLSAFLGQIVNWLYTLQGEAAGAQAVSSLDTYAAPFIRYDKLNFEQVKKAVQSFVFNLNVPTRVGFQTPFTNVTLEDFPWESEVSTKLMEMTSKFGTPYFANFLNSDMKPEDVRSMCCRLRLDNRELRKRGGGLFGANPLTGSINVVTLNMARLGYTAKTKEEFKAKMRPLMESARDICEQKRVLLEQYMDSGLYPYSRYYLEGVKEGQGGYYKNHFSTIGLNGMNEACLNLFGKDITTEEGQTFSIEVMDFMNEVIQDFQEETGSLYNLEASPAEGATYRFARMDKRIYPKIITSGDKEPYYTNSTQLPVGHTADMFEALTLQEELQTRYTGGTVLHGFIGEQIEDLDVLKDLLYKSLKLTRIPYLTITPTYSICQEHGYLAGEQWTCPTCGSQTEVWSRVVGFHRPVQSWNKGKQEEFAERMAFGAKETLKEASNDR